MPDNPTLDPRVAQYVRAALERQHTNIHRATAPSPASRRTYEALDRLVRTVASPVISIWERECRRLGFGTISMDRYSDFRVFIPLLNVPSTALAVGDPPV